MRTVIIKAIMFLSQLPVGSQGRVLQIEGGLGIRRNLSHLGVHEGDIVRMKGRGAFRGPFLVQVHGMQVALGRNIASQVHVHPVSNTPGDSHD